MPTVQQFLDSLSGVPYQNTGSAEVPQYSSLGSVGDLQQMLNTPVEFYGGQTPQQLLSQYGATDPMNQLDFQLPDPKEGSLFDDLGAYLPVMAFAGPALLSGLSGAAGGEIDRKSTRLNSSHSQIS